MKVKGQLEGALSGRCPRRLVRGTSGANRHLCSRIVRRRYDLRSGSGGPLGPGQKRGG